MALSNTETMQSYIQKQGIIWERISFELIAKLYLNLKSQALSSQNFLQDFSSKPVFTQESYKEPILVYVVTI